MKQKIVIAEDSPDHARILVAILAKNDFDVTWVKNGQEAYDYLKSNPMPDLLITDIMMPGISGFELMIRLKAESIMPPTLVISGCQREDDVLRGLEYGAEDYLSKPFSPKIVTAKVQNVLSRKSSKLAAVFAAFHLFTSLLGGGPSANAEPVSASVGAQRAWSEKYTSWFTNAQLAYQVTDTVQARVTTRRHERDYNGQANFNEWGAGLGAVVKTSWGYVDSAVGYTPEPVTFSRLLISVDPHLNLGANDVGLAVSTQRYEKLKVYTLRPSWFREWGSGFQTGFSLWLVNTPEWVASAQPTAVWAFAEQHQIRFDAAFGRTVEDANVLVQFNQFSGNYRYSITRAFGVIAGFQRYQSETRSENSVLASVEFK